METKMVSDSAVQLEAKDQNDLKVAQGYWTDILGGFVCAMRSKQTPQEGISE